MMLDPEKDAARRIDEIAAIMASGILRLLAKEARKSSRLRDISLDSSADQSADDGEH